MHDDRSASAIVFGASGAIGYALAERLVHEGRYDAVYAGVRDPSSRVPPGTRRVLFDLMDEGSIAAACAVPSAAPALVLVATGTLHDPARGIMPEKALRDLDPARLAHLFAINSIGPALIAKHSLPRLPRDRRGVFAALSARVGSIGDNRLGGWHGYRASKAALNMLLRNLSIELARTHPLAVVAALHPGTVESALSAPFLRRASPRKVQTADQAATRLLTVLDQLRPADSGGLFAWDGAPIPW